MLNPMNPMTRIPFPSPEQAPHMNPHETKWTWMRRVNHALLASMVVFQMIGSEWMTKPWRPGPDGTPGRLMFTLHEWAGLLAGVALAFIAWRMYRQGTLRRIDAAMRGRLLAQCRALIISLPALRLPRPEETAALARFVQVLGLLLTAGFCLTGAAIWWVGASTDLAHSIGELHELGVPLLYAYVGGHAGMALLHRMFDRSH